MTTIKLLYPTQYLTELLQPDENGFVSLEVMQAQFPNMNEKELIQFLSTNPFYEISYVADNAPENGDTNSQEKPAKKQSK